MSVTVEDDVEIERSVTENRLSKITVDVHASGTVRLNIRAASDSSINTAYMTVKSEGLEAAPAEAPPEEERPEEERHTKINMMLIATLAVAIIAIIVFVVLRKRRQVSSGFYRQIGA